jgi:hypothetical protein
MSYQHMDHAAWVENNNAAGRRLQKKPRRNRHGQIVGFHQAPEQLTEFQAKVMDIAGMVFGGINNAPITWETVDWDWGKGVSFIAEGYHLATFDTHVLTRFVFLCHTARIRGSIEPCGPRRVRMSFYQRSAAGQLHERHPSVDEAVEAFRDYLPSDHRIIYRESSMGAECNEAAA